MFCWTELMTQIRSLSRATRPKKKYTLFFISNAFLTQPQCCLSFPWIELQVLLRCCLIRISIIILRHFLYLLYLWPCLDLGLFMLYLCDLFVVFIFILIMINRMNTDTFVFLLMFLEYFLIFYSNVNEECEICSSSKSSASGCSLTFAWFFANFSLALLLKCCL